MFQIGNNGGARGGSATGQKGRRDYQNSNPHGFNLVCVVDAAMVPGRINQHDRVRCRLFARRGQLLPYRLTAVVFTDKPDKGHRLVDTGENAPIDRRCQ